MVKEEARGYSTARAETWIPTRSMSTRRMRELIRISKKVQAEAVVNPHLSARMKWKQTTKALEEMLRSRMRMLMWLPSMVQANLKL